MQTGYSLSRVSTLSMDPSMKELVAKYRARVDEKLDAAADQIAADGVRLISKYMRQVHDHFDQSDEVGELLPIASLAKIGPDLMDRFGYGKKNMNVNVNVDFAKHLEEAIARTKRVA
jgi:hypothetical protein